MAATQTAHPEFSVLQPSSIPFNTGVGSFRNPSFQTLGAGPPLQEQIQTSLLTRNIGASLLTRDLRRKASEFARNSQARIRTTSDTLIVPKNPRSQQHARKHAVRENPNKSYATRGHKSDAHLCSGSGMTQQPRRGPSLGPSL